MTAPLRIVELAGDLDLHSAHRVESRLADALDDGLPVVVDLTECTFLDLEAMRSLARGYSRASREGIGFAVVAPPHASGPVRRLLVEAPAGVAPFPVVASRAAGRAHAMRHGAPVDPNRPLGTAGSRAWRLLRRNGAFLTEDHELLLELCEPRARHHVSLREVA